MKIKIIPYILAVALISFSLVSFSKEKIPPATIGTITGTVTDKADGKPIIGASINIPDLRTGSITDINGHFTLNNLPRGLYLVQVSYLGYATFTEKVDFSTTTVLNVQLQASSIETGEVVITGVSKATEIKRDPVPMVAVGKTYLDEHSATGNVIDEIANLPGISAVTTGLIFPSPTFMVWAITGW